MAAKRIAYLTYDGLTDPLGQSQILPYVLGLSRLGYSFTIISFEKPEAFSKQQEVIKKQTDASSIKWIPLRYHKKPLILSTLYDVWCLWRILSKLNREHRFDIVHCRSYITSLIGLRMKRRHGVKFIFDMRGFWADERVEGGLWNLGNPIHKIIYKYFKQKERDFLIDADHTVSLTKSAQSHIYSWGLKTSSISVIPTCVDVDHFDSMLYSEKELRDLRLKLGINDEDFVVLYLGSWGTWYLTREMLQYFSFIKREKPEAKLLILSSDLINLNNYNERESVIQVSVARSKVPLHISLAKLAIFFIKPSFSKKASSATKLAEIMAMNVPIVTNGGWGDVDDLIGLTGVSVINLNKMNNHDLPQAKNNILRKYCVEHLSLSIGIKIYAKIYETL